MTVLDVGYAPQITAAAARMRLAAEQVRQRAGLLDSASASCRWDGAGARAFRHRAHETTTWLRHAALALDDTADALARHAGRVADEVAHGLAEQAAALDRARDGLLDLVSAAGDVVGRPR